MGLNQDTWPQVAAASKVCVSQCQSCTVSWNICYHVCRFVVLCVSLVAHSHIAFSYIGAAIISAVNFGWRGIASRCGQ